MGSVRCAGDTLFEIEKDFAQNRDSLGTSIYALKCYADFRPMYCTTEAKPV